MSERKTCEAYETTMVASGMDLLSDAEQSELLRHVEACAACRQAQATFAAEERGIRSAAAGLGANADALIARTADRIAGEDRAGAARAPGERWWARPLAAAAGLALAGTLLWAVLGDTGRGAAYAAALAHLQQLDRFACEIWLQPGDDAEGRQRLGRLIVQGDCARMEHYDSAGQLLYVRIFQGGEYRDFNPSTLMITPSQLATDPPWAGLERIAGLADETPERELGTRATAGGSHWGFTSTVTDEQTGGEAVLTVWIDRRSGLPADVELAMQRGDANYRMGYADMRWDVAVEPAAFEPPAGSTVVSHPIFPRTGEVLATRQVRSGISLSLASLVAPDDPIDGAELEWVALLRRDGRAALLIRLDDAGWERVRRTSPWSVQLGEALRSRPEVDPLTLDEAHRLVVFDASAVAGAVEQLLDEPGAAWTVTADADQP